MTEENFEKILADYDLSASDIEAHLQNGSSRHSKEQLNTFLDDWLEVHTGLAGSTDIPRDEMGQPLYGRSNYNAFSKLGEIIDADVGLTEKIGNLLRWSVYTVPDVEQRVAEREARVDPLWQIGQAADSPMGAAAYLFSGWAGATQETQDNFLRTGSVLDGILGGGARSPRVSASRPRVGGVRTLEPSWLDRTFSFGRYRLDNKWLNDAGQLRWVDPRTNELRPFRTGEVPTADHILARDVANSIPGSRSLPRDSQLKLINHPDNLQPMSLSANSSKGKKTEGFADGFRTWNGQPVDPKYRAELLRVQSLMRARIESEIQRRSGIND